MSSGESPCTKQLVLRYCVSYAAKDAPVVFGALAGSEYADLLIRPCYGAGLSLIMSSLDSEIDPSLGFIFSPDLTFGPAPAVSADKAAIRFGDHALAAACAKHAAIVAELHKIAGLIRAGARRAASDPGSSIPVTASAVTNAASASELGTTLPAAPQMREISVQVGWCAHVCVWTNATHSTSAAHPSDAHSNTTSTSTAHPSTARSHKPLTRRSTHI